MTRQQKTLKDYIVSGMRNWNQVAVKTALLAVLFGDSVEQDFLLVSL